MWLAILSALIVLFVVNPDGCGIATFFLLILAPELILLDILITLIKATFKD